MTTLKTFYIFRLTRNLSMIYVNFRQCYNKKDKELQSMLRAIEYYHPKDTVILTQEIERGYFKK